jgi:hypothetical protein
MYTFLFGKEHISMHAKKIDMQSNIETNIALEINNHASEHMATNLYASYMLLWLLSW